MNFKNCPECKGEGVIISTNEYGVTTFERCYLCRDRTIFKKEFEKLARLGTKEK